MTENKVIEWLAERGHTGYRDRIVILQRAIMTLLDHADGDKPVATIRSMQEEIDSIKRGALDRYEDWASDPLP